MNAFLKLEKINEGKIVFFEAAAFKKPQTDVSILFKTFND